MVNTSQYYIFRVFWILLYTFLYQCVVYFHNFMLLVTILLFLFEEFSQDFSQGLSSADELLHLFFFFEKVLFLLNFLRRALLGNIFLFTSFFFLLVLWIYHPTLSWPVSFLLRNPLTAYLGLKGGSPLVNYFFSLTFFKRVWDKIYLRWVYAAIHEFHKLEYLNISPNLGSSPQALYL